MPRATVSTDTEKFDLKSCPGGWVELSRLTYGQLIERREMAADMKISGGGGQNVEGSIKQMQARVTDFEFKHCITSHNLEDADGELLNFKLAGIWATLDPRIGDEISTLIDNMNQFEADQGNSSSVPEPA